MIKNNLHVLKGSGRERVFPGRRNKMLVKWSWENLAKGEATTILADSTWTRSTIVTSLKYFLSTYKLNWGFTISGKAPFTVTRVK